MESEMSDLIDRAAAINAFDCTDELIVSGSANAQNVMNYINKVIDKINALPSVTPEQRWISVSERLPEDGLYLVTTSKGQVQVHVFSHNGNSEEYWMRCNKAWMPLPEPYRGE